MDANGDGIWDSTLKTVYDGDNAYADFDASSSLTNRYLYGQQPDQIFARVSASGNPDFYLTDRLGSVRQIADVGSGAALDTITYDSFGNILSETSQSVGDRFKFTAREWDSEIGLQYNRARYYDPKTGRWINQDPLGFEAHDPNLYRYIRNAPTNSTDPSGMSPTGISSFWRIAEFLIGELYRLEHPRSLILTGTVPAFPLAAGFVMPAGIASILKMKPDITNLSANTYNEIKPLNVQGTFDAASQMALRAAQFALVNRYGIPTPTPPWRPDVWWHATSPVVVGPVVFFNLLGVLFYVDVRTLIVPMYELEFALAYATSFADLREWIQQLDSIRKVLALGGLVAVGGYLAWAWWAGGFTIASANSSLSPAASAL